MRLSPTGLLLQQGTERRQLPMLLRLRPACLPEPAPGRWRAPAAAGWRSLSSCASISCWLTISNICSTWGSRVLLVAQPLPYRATATGSSAAPTRVTIRPKASRVSTSAAGPAEWQTGSTQPG